MSTTTQALGTFDNTATQCRETYEERKDGVFLLSLRLDRWFVDSFSGSLAPWGSFPDAPANQGKGEQA
jgi:hypothetical protein